MDVGRYLSFLSQFSFIHFAVNVRAARDDNQPNEEEHYTKT